MAPLSSYYANRKPSDNRMAQIEFAKRTDAVKAINVSVGNVSLPMHPAMQKRMFDLKNPQSPVAHGSVRYTQTVGTLEAQEAYKNILRSAGFPTENLYVQITDGGSLAMELVIVGVADPHNRPILLIDAVYTNYLMFARRTARKTVSIQRTLDESGTFSFPSFEEIEKTIQTHKPTAIVIIPYDNPTGQLYDYETIKNIARLCVKYDMWLVSDEAYRELHYKETTPRSIWGLTENDVPGIVGRRISIESASKVRNACGLRIGAVVTDNAEFHEKCVAEQTANLCANTLGQYIFGALAHETPEALKSWYEQQRAYYGSMIKTVAEEFKKHLPGIIVANPDAAIYMVVDVRRIVKPGFSSKDFALFCAREGNVNGETLLISPLVGFYQGDDQAKNPGLTQFRISFVESPEVMQKVPFLFAELLKQYEAKRSL